MKRIRWQAVAAGGCSLLAFLALSFLHPVAGVAENGARQDPALKAMGPGIKGTVPVVHSKLPAPTNEAIVFLKPGASAAQVALAHGLVIKNRLKSDSNIVVMAAGSL